MQAATRTTLESWIERLLPEAQRALSRLLGADWPRTLDELEALKKQ